MIGPLVAALVAAQAAGPLLTLDDALREARDKNLDLKVAKAKLDQAHELSAKTWANYLPTITAGGAYTYNNATASITLPTGYYVRDAGKPQGPAFDPTKPASPENPPGGQTNYFMMPSGLLTADIQKQHQLGAQVELRQAILAPALFPAIQASYLGEKSAELNVENARRELLFGVAQLYFGVAGLKQAVAIQRHQLEAMASHEKDAKVRVDTGAAPRLLLLRAQIDRARAELDVQRAENALKSATSSLATLLDRAPDFEVEAPAEPPLPPGLAGDDAESKALASRPDVEAARVGVEIAEKTRTAALLKYAPNVGLTARLQAANVGGFTGESTTWAVTLGLNWTLFDGGLREAERREASAKLDEATYAAKSAELKAKDEVRRALLELESARSNREKAEETVSLARENMKLVTVNFQAGVATPLEVSDANTALLSAELGALAETLNARLAVLRLAKVAGAFDPR